MAARARTTNVFADLATRESFAKNQFASMKLRSLFILKILCLYEYSLFSSYTIGRCGDIVVVIIDKIL